MLSAEETLLASFGYSVGTGDQMLVRVTLLYLPSRFAHALERWAAAMELSVILKPNPVA